MNNSFTFLEEEQIFGDKALDIIKKYGTKAAITDFSILLGGYVDDNCHTNEGDTDKDRTSWWWTRTNSKHNDARVVSHDGHDDTFDVDSRDLGARPALPYSSIRSIASNEVRDNFGIKEVEYGEYPQTIVDERFSRELEENYKRGSGIRKTGKTYTTDSVNYNDFDTSFEPRKHEEFEYMGRKYIRVIADYNGSDCELSDGRITVSGEPYWVAVEPIKWLVDERANIALSKKIIFSGVQFQKTHDYKGDFNQTDIKQFIDKYFSKDIIANKNSIDLSNINLTLLGYEQVFWDKALDVIKKYGVKAKITDLAVVLGGYCDPNEGTGWYWTKDQSSSQFALVVDSDGNRGWNSVNYRSGGARPVLPYSSIQSICSNVVRDSNGILTVTCGEYPQYAASENIQVTLNLEYKTGGLNNTGNCYVFDSRKYNDYDNGFSPEVYDEYEYQGKKYIRVKANSDYIWIEVLPVEWIIDEKENLAISKNILVAGIRYDDENKYDGNFEHTEMYDYLNDHMILDLFQGLNPKKEKRKINPYGFDFGEVSEEDIIRGSVESDVPVFLHAKSGDGKSARAKELDPDCTIIYMRTATPDSLNGKSVYNSQTGEMIDVKPSWLRKLEEKCAKEPDKLHILFFDELTNALPSIQSMAFNIVLDKEVNGIWKLPENSRIIAAGNDMEDSLAANQMAEPLFNRFAHVYIETTPEEWLEWATTPEEDYERLEYKKSEKRSKIHPAIYAFIAGNTYNDRGASVLRTKPKTDELKPHADPRKWELASKVLHATNNPEMLRGLIGEELTKEFVEFTQVKAITVEAVINGEYTEDDLRMNTAEKFATAVGLSSVDEEHFTVVREFMLKIGAEPCAAFESMWHHGNQKRLMMIAEAQISQGGRMI